MLTGALATAAQVMAQPTAEKDKTSAKKAAKDKPAKEKTKKAKGKAEADEAEVAGPLPPSRATPRLPAEAEHVTRFDSAIAAVREAALSPENGARLREAFTAIVAGKISEARALRDQIGNSAASKLIDWYTFRGGYGTSAEVRTFIEANPAWPDRGMLSQRAEEALFSSNASPREIKAFFATIEPRTAVGLAALASALAAEKDEARAKVIAVKAWTEYDVSAANEPAFLKRIGGLLTEADHKRRLDRLLAGAGRLAGDRKDRAVVIKRTIALLDSEAERKQAEARLAVFLRAKNAGQLMAKLPAHSHADWGVAVQKAQSLRRQKKEEEAWKILLTEPDTAELTKPDGWWEERRTSAYAALRIGKPKTAYDLVRSTGALSINATKDAAFMAGWLALRHLNDPKLALTHFQALAKAADGPLSNARGQYWLGRTHEALGDQTKATEAYRAASAYYDTFHGQLARLKLDPKASLLKLTPPTAPGSEEIARFNANDAVVAAVLARKAGLDISITRSFLMHLRNQLKSETEVAMLAHLADALGDPQSAVRIGKTAIGRGMNLAYYAYPVHSLPEYKPLREPVEPAFILGIARQESEFNTFTKSGAGARGILQVMPVTAKHVCADYKIKCELDRLMKDPAYNTMLGSAYISDRMEEFSGSYVLTLAGYNAGPGRARQWMKEFGDPRDGKVDPIDWIHRIPFEETREYVQKVLSNIQVYRARLGEQESALRLNADLKRISAAPAAP